MAILTHVALRFTTCCAGSTVSTTAQVTVHFHPWSVACDARFAVKYYAVSRSTRTARPRFSAFRQVKSRSERRKAGGRSAFVIFISWIIRIDAAGCYRRCLSRSDCTIGQWYLGHVNEFALMTKANTAEAATSAVFSIAYQKTRLIHIHATLQLWHRGGCGAVAKTVLRTLENELYFSSLALF